jgi:hypothetical protein
VYDDRRGIRARPFTGGDVGLRMFPTHSSSCLPRYPLSRTPAPRIGVIVAIISLLLVSDAHAQTVPFIGSIIWTHSGYDCAAKRFRNIEAVDQASHAGVVIIGTNTATNNVPCIEYMPSTCDRTRAARVHQGVH